jgi:hypothetical protein
MINIPVRKNSIGQSTDRINESTCREKNINTRTPPPIQMISTLNPSEVPMARKIVTMMKITEAL